MSTALYDLGARLRAASTGEPVARRRHPAQPTPARPVAVTVDTDPGGAQVVTATRRDGTTATGRGRDGLAALSGLGIAPRGSDVPTLVLAERGALAALARLARATAPGTAHADAAAVVAWWDQRADHPGMPSVLVAPEVAASRWALGERPAAEADFATWARWLGLGTPGPAALLDLAAAATAGEVVPGAAALADIDARSWDYLTSRVAKGWDWRRRDNRVEAALGLVTRTEAADLAASLALDDPAVCARESFAGTVVTGTITELDDRTMQVSATRPLSRLREANPVHGWRGGPAQSAKGLRMRGQLSESTVTPDGTLSLRITRVQMRGAALGLGNTITLRPEPVTTTSYAHSVLARRFRSSGNWLGHGRSPAPQRRDVPLDVLIAAADDDS